MTFSPSFIRGATIGTVLSIGALAAIPALAYRGDPTVQGPRFDQERHEQMQAAFENRDFEAWSTLMEEESGRHPRVLDQVTEENFDSFAEIHELMLSGDHEGAKALREELGLGGDQMGMKMHGPGKGKGQGRGPGGCFGRGMGPKGMFGELTEEQRTELHEAMRACKDSGEDWAAVKECHKEVFEQYKTEE